MARIAVDTGGTFTDAVMDDDGYLSFFKAPSSPNDYAVGLLASIEPWQSRLPNCELFIHGTTVCLNALLQGKLPKTALVTTKGFRDVVGIQRSNRTSIYDPMYRKPKPLVPRRLRFEVHERIGSDGSVILPLNDEDVEMVIAGIQKAEVDSVAICLVNSYVNGDHEAKIEQLLRTAGIANVCKSTDVSREYREYERSCTTILNASLMPIMSVYIDSLAHKLEGMGLPSEVRVMQSNGGITGARVAREKPVQTINSGLVGGVIATAALAEAIGEGNAIGTDMGGTSFDVCLVVDGQYGTLPALDIVTPESGQGSYPIQVSTLDTHTIGAGGGSIVWLDQGGFLHVGPQSAGADPGPACYGRGGDQPTVTDLNFVLDRLDPDMFLGGRMRVFPERSRRALEPLADYFGTAIEETADGALTIAVNNMANAIRTMTIDRGIDPREFTLISAGGAGPLHASLIAKELQMQKVVVPEMPGNFAAWGMLCTDLKHDFTRTIVAPLAAMDPKVLTEAFVELEQEATNLLMTDGVNARDAILLRSLMLRYVGQGHAMEVPLHGGPLGISDWQQVTTAFDDMHLAAYAHNAPAEPKEVVGIKVTGIGAVERPRRRRMAPGRGDPSSESCRDLRSVYFKGRREDCRVFDRAGFRPGNRFAGPAIVEEESSTTFVLPAQMCTVDAYGNLILEWGADS